MWKLTTIILVLAFVALCNAQINILCESNSECPENSFCSGPSKAVSKTSKAKKRCFPCDCNEKDQCYFGGFNNLEILCDCADSGYTGATCEILIDPCVPNPCENGGTCTSDGGTVSCECDPLWGGEFCDVIQN